MSLSWQISTGGLFEVLRPAAFVLAVLLSTWVLADARSNNFASYAILIWTLSTLFFPHIVSPLYLLARMISRRRVRLETERTEHTLNTTPRFPDNTGTDMNERVGDGVYQQSFIPAAEGKSSDKPPATLLKSRLTLPFAYALLTLALGALCTYQDARSVDAHLARANHARLRSQRETTIREIQSALALEDDPHTRKLLGVELIDAGRWNEALAEFSAAERGGEPDEKLSYLIAAAFDALNRPAEAAPRYQQFLNSRLCTQQLPPTLICATASARLNASSAASVR